jgi:hypothetical protein
MGRRTAPSLSPQRGGDNVRYRESRASAIAQAPARIWRQGPPRRSTRFLRACSRTCNSTWPSSKRTPSERPRAGEPRQCKRSRWSLRNGKDALAVAGASLWEWGRSGLESPALALARKGWGSRTSGMHFSATAHGVPAECGSNPRFDRCSAERWTNAGWKSRTAHRFILNTPDSPDNIWLPTR